jgi:hypothetical protein
MEQKKLRVEYNSWKRNFAFCSGFIHIGFFTSLQVRKDMKIAFLPVPEPHEEHFIAN